MNIEREALIAEAREEHWHNTCGCGNPDSGEADDLVSGLADALVSLQAEANKADSAFFNVYVSNGKLHAKVMRLEDERDELLGVIEVIMDLIRKADDLSTVEMAERLAEVVIRGRDGRRMPDTTPEGGGMNGAEIEDPISAIHEEREALADLLRWHADNLAEDGAYEYIQRDLRATAEALVSVQAERDDRDRQIEEAERRRLRDVQSVIEQRDVYRSKLSAISEKLSTPLDKSKVLNTPYGRTHWQAILAGQVRVILAQFNAANPLAARDAENRAAGWDEGAKWMSESEYGEPFTDDDKRQNPYRKAGEK